VRARTWGRDERGDENGHGKRKQTRKSMWVTSRKPVRRTIALGLGSLSDSRTERRNTRKEEMRKWGLQLPAFDEARQRGFLYAREQGSATYIESSYLVRVKKKRRGTEFRKREGNPAGDRPVRQGRGERRWPRSKGNILNGRATWYNGREGEEGQGLFLNLEVNC